MESYDLTIIGGGPGGYAAALRAANLNLKTILIEKEELGGTCLNRGCIPTKIYAHAANFSHQLSKMDSYGFEFGEPHFNMSKLHQRKENTVETLKEGLQGMLKKAKVEIVCGTGRALTPHEILIEKEDGKQKVHTSSLLLATGGKESLLEIPGIDLPGVITSKEALELTQLPSSLVIVGGGVIALEFASIFSSLGTSVTILHRSERFLRGMDLEMVKRLSTFLRRQGVKIYMNASLKHIDKTEKEELEVKFVSPKEEENLLTAEKVLISTGRKPFWGDQDLEALEVDHGSDGIYVNEKMETSNKSIYAVGDATFPGYFQADVAYHQGIAAAENAAGLNSAFRRECIPSCLFTFPELAKAGLTEEEAKQKGFSSKVGKFPFTANGKAACKGEAEGLVKIIANEGDEVVLGVHILGPQASELIQEGNVAVSKKIKVTELADLVHTHPTLSEAIWEAALSITKNSLHFRS